jgi:hypothetical protein
MVTELRHWWKIIRTAVLAIGVLLTFFVLVEVLHVYTILRDTWYPLGYAFLLLIVAGFTWFSVYLFLNIRKRPKVLVPPHIKDLTVASPGECHDYCRYLVQYIERLILNPNLPAESTDIARRNIAWLEKFIESDSQPSVLLAEIDKTEKDIIEPCLSKLDEKAEGEVRKSVRDVMLGVTLSPYRAVDLLIVIYRNATMVNKIMCVYNSRPLLRDQVLIFRDVLRVVATVNYMNFGQKLMEQFLSRVPYIGPTLDDFAQGIGAGLLTSVAGHGAIYRCRSYERWDQEIAVQTMSSHVKGFVNDVKNMFKEDVLPKMRNRIYAAAPTDKTDDPGFWEKTTNGISSALDTTEIVIDSLIRKPVVAGGKGTIKVGSSAISKGRDVMIKGTSGLWRGTKSVASATGKSIRFAGIKASNACDFAGNRIKKIVSRKNKQEK